MNNLNNFDFNWEVMKNCNKNVAEGIAKIFKENGFDFEKCKFEDQSGVMEISYKGEVLLRYKQPKIIITKNNSHVYSLEILQAPNYLEPTHIMDLLRPV